MQYFAEKEFLEQIEKSPLFKSFKKRPGKTFLKKIKFSKENYSDQGLILLRDLYASSFEKKNDKKRGEKMPPKLFNAYWAYTEKVHDCIKLIASGKRKSLSLIKILWLSPEFEKQITDIRLKYKIIPSKYKGEIYSKFTEEERPLVANEIENVPNIDTALWRSYSKEELNMAIEKIVSIKARIIACIYKKIPQLDIDIESIRIRYGLTPSYDNYLKDFVLFDRISPEDTLPIKQKRNYREKANCEFNLTKEDAIANTLKRIKPFQPHISIHLYGSTPLESAYDELKLLYGVHPLLGKDSKNFLKHLSSYSFKKTIPDLKYEIILRKAMLYFFREVQGLSINETVSMFKYLGMKTSASIITRDIKAFKKVFRINKP